MAKPSLAPEAASGRHAEAQTIGTVRLAKDDALLRNMLCARIQLPSLLV